MAKDNNSERARYAALDRNAFMRYARHYRAMGLPGGAETCAHFARMARVANWRAIYWRAHTTQAGRLASLIVRNSRI